MSALYGRAAETARLRERVGAGGRVVLVTGPAGVGKTRLVAEAVPAAVWVTFPRQRFQSPGYGLRGLATARADAALAAELDLAADAAGADHAAAIRSAADAALAGCAPALVLDDAQWADDLTLSWLGGAVPLPDGVSVVVVVRGDVPARVTEALAAARAAGALDPLPVAPLRRDDVAALARELGVGGADDVDALYDASLGLPLAVEALAGARHDVPARGAAVGSPVPPALLRFAGAQLDALPRTARTAVVHAALAAQPVPVALLARALGRPAGRVRDALDAAVSSGLVSAAGGVTFRHELYREAIQLAASGAERRRCHSRLADALTTLPGSRPEQVASHLLDAGRAAEALPWLDRVVADAAERHDAGTALAALDTAVTEAIGLGDTGAVERFAVQVAPIARAAHQAVRGLAVTDRALAALPPGAARGRVLLGHARLVSYRGDYLQRITSLDRARADFERAGDTAGLATALAELALPLDDGMPLARKVEYGERALRAAEAGGDPEAVAISAANLATARTFAGHTANDDLWQRATGTSAGTAPSEMVLRSGLNHTILSVDDGRYAAAADLLAKWRPATDDPRYLRMFDAVDAFAAWRTGAWDRALAIARTQPPGIAYPVTPIAHCAAAVIDFERGRVLGAPALVEDLTVDFSYAAVIVHLRARRREPSPARGVLPLFDDIAHRGHRFSWEDLLLEVAIASLPAYRRVARVLGDLRPAGGRAEAVLAHVDGVVALAADPALAEARLRAAAEAYASLGEPYGEARALDTAATARLRAGGRPGDLRRRAAEIYEALGADRSLAALVRGAGTSVALQGFRVPASQVRAPSPGLTAREREVAELAARGRTAAEIAQRLGLSVGTVRNHIAAVRTKLGVKHKRDLVELLGTD